ncbi:protein O13 [Cercopithecine betaherpesvirus 5]|uniref:Protein O13 n=1 Tax=Simian cytomegalovirus (strain Colburn) TaxID=50292 RepID=G8XU31_SCMVC|nr:protein O13 [Cercopithecine betaherpesvirus 5]
MELSAAEIGALVFAAICILLSLAGIIFLCHYPREALLALRDVLTCAFLVSCYRYGCNPSEFKDLAVLDDGKRGNLRDWLRKTYERWRYGPSGGSDRVEYYSPPDERAGETREEMVTIHPPPPRQTVVTIEGGQTVTRIYKGQPDSTEQCERPSVAEPLMIVQQELECAITMDGDEAS